MIIMFCFQPYMVICAKFQLNGEITKNLYSMQFVQTKRLKEIKYYKMEIAERVTLQLMGGLLLKIDDPNLKVKQESILDKLKNGGFGLAGKEKESEDEEPGIQKYSSQERTNFINKALKIKEGTITVED